MNDFKLDNLTRFEVATIKRIQKCIAPEWKKYRKNCDKIDALYAENEALLKVIKKYCDPIKDLLCGYGTQDVLDYVTSDDEGKEAWKKRHIVYEYDEQQAEIAVDEPTSEEEPSIMTNEGFQQA